MRPLATAQLLILLSQATPLVTSQDSSSSCLDYSTRSRTRHPPFSPGRHALSSARPSPSCRTFNLSSLESLLGTLPIADPDLLRLWQNTYPNTLDTAIKWHGHSNSPDSEEELTFIITGDINAMWLRDSARQLQSYLPLLTPSPSSDSLASLFRGTVNTQARNVLSAGYCNSFRPPPESGIISDEEGGDKDVVRPEYDRAGVFECKWEVDSLASFLELSRDYYFSTHDIEFFARQGNWTGAVRRVVEVGRGMQRGTTYGADGRVLGSGYSFARMTTRSTETLANDGAGSPVASGTGLVRSAFRPSDDATTYQFLVPGNMMFCVALAGAAVIAEDLGEQELAGEMRAFSREVREGIEKFGVVEVVGEDGVSKEKVYAYEVDGFGGVVLGDDANLPSLLSAPVMGYVAGSDPVYQATRRRILSRRNPYYADGEVVRGVGSPHTGPGKVWPMSLVMQIMTSEDDEEIRGALKQILGSTDGLGLIHESIDGWDSTKWTREWFSWANGLFGAMIVDLAKRKEGLLRESFQ